jgi:uncharacterized protein (DUF736 family)
MMEYSNENTGALFKNETDNEKAPQYKGKINVDGTEYQIAAWLKTSKAGTKFMSLKVQPAMSQGVVKAAPKQTIETLDSDVPF